MFYLVGNRIFSMVKDPKLKAYPEIHIVRHLNGSYSVTPGEGYIHKLPNNYKVCSLSELFAKLDLWERPKTPTDETEKGKPDGNEQ